MRADNTIRETAAYLVTQPRSEDDRIMDDRILAATSRELVAAEAHYHKSCYKDYTRSRLLQRNTRISSEYSEAENPYDKAERMAFNKLFDYIRNELFLTPQVRKMTDLTLKLETFLFAEGQSSITEKTKKSIRRKLESEFGLSLHIVSSPNGRLLVFPDNLTTDKLAEQVIYLQDMVDTYKSQCNFNDMSSKVAAHIRNDIHHVNYNNKWPPHPNELDSNFVEIPPSLTDFLSLLVTGEGISSNRSTRAKRSISSISQDIIYAATAGQVTTAKHILLPWAVKSLSGNVELIKCLNRLGHGISYTKLSEIDTALCMRKIARKADNTILPCNIFPYIPTVLAFGNIDRIEETLTGAGTSHRVNGIIVQPQVHFAHNLIADNTCVTKSKQRTIPCVDLSQSDYHCSARKNPPATAPVDMCFTRNADVDFARQQNLIWLLMRLCHKDNQLVSSWTGFSIKCNTKVDIAQDTVEYLPTINAPATEMSTIYTLLEQVLNIAKALQVNDIICVFDQAIYAKATEIIWQNPFKFRSVVLQMGAFHIILNLLCIIGKRYGDAGLRDLAVESGIIAEGSISSVLEGRQYNRGVRLHKIVYEGLMRLLWKEFNNWLEKERAEDLATVKSGISEFEQLATVLDNQRISNVISSKCCTEVLNLFETFIAQMRQSSSRLTAFWMSYVDMVELLLALIRATRQGNWSLHLHAIRSVVPWCFAYDRHNYARYLSIYYADMMKLPKEHPFAFEHVSNGGFAVQLSSSNPFGRIPVDQTVEETVNKDTQTAGGTKGFSLKPSAVCKYYLNAEYRNISLKQLRNMISVPDSEVKHPDLGQKRILRDESDVEAVVEMLDINWVNPFRSNDGDLVKISSGIVASSEVTADLSEAQQKGEAAYKTFVESRLVTGKSFYDPLKKLRLKTFSSMNVRTKPSSSVNKVTTLKADYQVFSRMLLIAQSRQMNVEEVLQHPLGPLPWSLANSDGTLKKTNKSSLARNIAKLAPSEDVIKLPNAAVIDGMAVVQKLNGDNCKFGEPAEILLDKVLHMSPLSDRVDVVFDVYREQSIKQAERVKRGSEFGIAFAVILPDHKIKNWRRILSCSASKDKLTQFFATAWQDHTMKLGNKELYVTCGSKCVRIRQDGIEAVSDLESTHEEADTRLFLHALHASKSGYKSVTVFSEDTDVMVLSLACSCDVSCDIYIRCGTRNRLRLLHINKLASALGRDVCNALPGFHAFTGCDSVSAIAGQGKLKGLKLMRQCQKFIDVFTELGKQWNLPTQLFAGLQEFICKLYASRSDVTLVNERRYHLWIAKKGAVESGQLPPCADCFYQHCLRANYQTAVWRRCLEANPDVPSPQNSGWTIESGSGMLLIKWMTGSPAPELLLSFMSCKCRQSCDKDKCPCWLNGLKCTSECKLTNCLNMPNDEDDVGLPVDSDSNTDSDSEDE